MGILSTGTCVKECPTIETDIQCVQTSAMTKAGSGFDGCVYQMDVQFIIDLLGEDNESFKKYIEKFYPGGQTAYDANKNAANSGSIKIPFRYKTSTLYGFCVPVFEADGFGAFGKEAI
jgi:hypothetical protein